MNRNPCKRPPRGNEKNIQDGSFTPFPTFPRTIYNDIYIYIPRSFLANILSQHSFHSSLQLLAHFSLSSLVTKRTHAIISTRTIRFASRLLPLSVLSLPSYIVRSGVQFLSYTRSRTHAYSLSLSLARKKSREPKSRGETLQFLE